MPGPGWAPVAPCNLRPGGTYRLGRPRRGRGCYRRHAFKQEIARKGHGRLANLERAYRENFETWIEDGALHIRYGKVSKGCYCPAARNRPA